MYVVYDARRVLDKGATYCFGFILLSEHNFNASYNVYDSESVINRYIRVLLEHGRKTIIYSSRAHIFHDAVSETKRDVTPCA